MTVLREGGVAVMPTDTIYGVVGSALNPETVRRIYALRGRDPGKPCIILIGDVSELEKFSISLSEKEKAILSTYWPEPVSIVFDCKDEAFSYLHRGTSTLAFRVPAPDELRELLIRTGPLVAPSANPEKSSPSKTIAEAK